MKLQSFTTQVLGLHPGFWTGDIDRQPDLNVLSRLCDGTSVSLERAQATGLAAFEGRLWERYQSLGPMEWLTPLGRNGRRRRMCGQQYCRQCLESDTQPYFRRRWRLAFNVACERHGTFLEDACPHCRAPVEFHAGDFGQKLLDFECPINRCGSCRSDLSQWHLRADRQAPRPLVNFQGALNHALLQGYDEQFPGAFTYSHLFFTGLRHLVQLLCSRGRFSRARDRLLSRNGFLGLDVMVDRRWQKFEALRVGDRAYILELVVQLIQEWPYGFVEICRESRVSSSYILSYTRELPFWLTSEVRWYLDDRDYSPSMEERAAVTEYLLKYNLPTSHNNVNRWLGVSSVSKLIGQLSRCQMRWNPRGSR